MEAFETKQLGDNAQLWVFALATQPDNGQRDKLACVLDEFVSMWNTHGAPVTGEWMLLHDRFVVVGAQVAEGISGCSIDSLVANFKELQAEGLDGLNRDLVFYRDSTGDINACRRVEFKALAAEGHISPTTRMFDTTIQTVGELRGDRFERDFRNSWHSRVFPVGPVRTQNSQAG